MTWSNSWLWALHSQLTVFIHFHTLSASSSLYIFIYLVYLGTWQVLAFLAYFFSSAEDVEACTAHDPRRSCQSKRKATGRLRAPKPKASVMFRVPSKFRVFLRAFIALYRAFEIFRTSNLCPNVSKWCPNYFPNDPRWRSLHFPEATETRSFYWYAR